MLYLTNVSGEVSRLKSRSGEDCAGVPRRVGNAAVACRCSGDSPRDCVAVGYGIRKNITHVARLQFGWLNGSRVDILQLDGETRYVFNDENVRLRPFVDGGLSYLRVDGENAGFVKAGLGLSYFLSPRYALEASAAIGLGKVSNVDGTSGLCRARLGIVWHREASPAPRGRSLPSRASAGAGDAVVGWRRRRIWHSPARLGTL